MLNQLHIHKLCMYRLVNCIFAAVRAVMAAPFMILNQKLNLVDITCVIGDVTPETITGFFETLCS